MLQQGRRAREGALCATSDMERAETSDQGALQTPATGGSKVMPQTAERGEQHTARAECTGDTGDQMGPCPTPEHEYNPGKKRERIPNIVPPTT